MSAVFALALALYTAAPTPTAPADFDRLLDSFPLIDEINPATQPPVHESPEHASRAETLLDRPARVLPMDDSPRVMAWVVGRDKGLKPGDTYVLEIEYPDDSPRSIFIANRGADLVRGFATGTATGDARQQYTQPSLESLAYPQTHQWQRYRLIFTLHHRFQGLYAQRDPASNGRPFKPADGFHVIIFQTRHINDPRSQGAAIGHIRLRHVPDITALYADVEFPPPELPRRRVFYREEMADEAVSAKAPDDRATLDPVDWFLYKARLARVLAINTFTKDLLEFGHNQGFDSGDQNWLVNAQPPLTNLWPHLVPRIAAEGLDIIPYYEYKGALGLSSAKPLSLGHQRRAEKLYHNLPNTRYTGVWWTEAHNADLTDPDTLADAKRVLDKTVLDLKGQGHFAGVWFRVRDNHLPISFADAATARFRADFPDDPLAQKANRPALIESYEGDHRLYDRYIDWWLHRRAAFLTALRDHLAVGLKNDEVQLIFTPWTCEPIPLLRDLTPGQPGHPCQITTDDPAWWDAFAKSQPNSSWFRWAWVPKSFDEVVKNDYYAQSLAFREKVTEAPHRTESYHSAPSADPENYRDNPHVMLTYPIARLFTVARPDTMERYRSAAGLTVVHHYTLNEDNHDRTKGPSTLPFDGQLGYICVDTDRAGPYVRLLETRAVANGDPRNLAALCASSFSTGFPGYVRRFNAAFLAVPALPSRIIPNAATDPEVIVREIPTPRSGTYYYVANTSMHPKTNLTLHLPARGSIRDLTDHRDLPSRHSADNNGSPVNTPRLDLYPGELRSFRVGP